MSGGWLAIFQESSTTSLSPAVSSPTPSPAASRHHQPRPRIRERWFLQANPEPTSSPDLSTSSPPRPGLRHDYKALTERARVLRDSIMSARKQDQLNQSTKQVLNYTSYVAGFRGEGITRNQFYRSSIVIISSSIAFIYNLFSIYLRNIFLLVFLSGS